jgi:hypothetical protein
MAYPNQIGLPCWSREQVSKVISLTAQTSASSAACFLAAHSPFQRIIDSKSAGRTVTEELAFNDIFLAAPDNVQVFIKGEPGTGKSHLIRWLKERFDYAVRQNRAASDSHRVVLVTRGNGSLKDALSQMVRQLGAEFEQHIHRVQGAIARLSDQTARSMLLAELALEVDTRWANERGRSPLPRSLKHLGQALRSNGFGDWKKRKGGVIEQVIQRLSDASTVEQRESFPAFDQGDFDVPAGAFRPQQVSPEVFDFIENLREEPETRRLAAEVLNTALKDAIRGLTGLKSEDLLGIITDIRRQLGPARQLVVFIEDVSASSGGLDQDVVNAFEKRDADDLCRMVAILGIADFGWEKLLGNAKQRPTHIYEVGGATVQQWAADQAEVARFTARYLNAIRSSDEEIEAIAEGRFEGDIGKSHCDDCPCKSECHAVFDKVDFGRGVTVGLFPFSRRAPQSMLQHLVDAKYKSQRGLLDRVLSPALGQSLSSLNGREFPQQKLFAVQAPTISFWQMGFLPRYCSGAGWSEENKSRMRFLAQFWVEAHNAEELASVLKPYLRSLGLPDFSSEVAPPPPHPAGGNQGGEVSQPPLPHDRELDRLLGLLDRWHDGQHLSEDSKFRDLLSDLLSKSIIWEDYKGIPIGEKKRLIDLGGNRIPKIKDQKSQPSSAFICDFPRSDETLSLLQSLLKLARSPSKSWNFPHGESHKREVSRWLRKHQNKTVAAVQPGDSSIINNSLRSAVQAMSLTAHLRERKRIPDNRAERVNCLFRSVWSAFDRPTVLSPGLEVILTDLEQKHAALRDFIVQELGVGQGSANPKDFINPMPLLALLDDFEKDHRFDPPPIEAEHNFWCPRFVAVKSLRQGAFQSIPDRLKMEHAALGEAVKNVKLFVSAAGFDKPEVREALECCLVELVQVIELQRGGLRRPGVLEIYHEAFDLLWQKKLIQDVGARSLWFTAVGRASELATDWTFVDLMAFNPAKLKECAEVLRIVEKHLEIVDQHLKDEEGSGGPGGDGCSELVGLLDEIATLAEQNKKGETVAE